MFVSRLFLPVLLLLASPALAAERILDYQSDIRIGADARIEVAESITVQAEGNAIRRGIYRDFPTRYRDRFGNRYQVDFRLLEVTRNGEPEASHMEKRSNGVRVYAGSPNRMLEQGVHTYVIRYATDRQVGYFEDFDEFYWNVTGNGWAFPIERAGARITLPGDVDTERLRISLYTGAQGSDARDGEYRVTGPRTVEILTTRGLASYEGLTVAVGWPKGLVHEPGGTEKAAYFFRDNAGALVMLVAWLAALGWYAWAWNRKGRDPQKGVIIPRYKPPEGLSPAASRYVENMGLDRNAFTAAVISLGVKGRLVIREEDDDFTLQATESESEAGLSKGEEAVLFALLPGGRGTIELDNENHPQFRNAHSGLTKALAAEYKGRLFNLNGWYAVPAFFLSIFGLVGGIVMGAGPLPWVLYGVGSVGMHILFIFLLRAPTVIGREVLDEIEGFKMYLDTAEQDRLDRMQSPELTPEVFELFLPYAFALGVQNNWCSRFEREFPDLQDPDKGYHPAWYHGNLRGASALSHISSDLGSNLSGAISSASTPPGSSSGSGGGGFSGGGGGGGGGGGW